MRKLRSSAPRLAVLVVDAAVDIAPEAFQMTTVETVTLDGVELVKMRQGGREGLDLIEGRAVVTEIEETASGPERREARLARQRWIRELRAARPALIVVLDRRLPSPSGYFDEPVLVEPPSPFHLPERVVTTSSSDLARLYAALPMGSAAGRL